MFNKVPPELRVFVTILIIAKQKYIIFLKFPQNYVFLGCVFSKVCPFVRTKTAIFVNPVILN